MRVLTETHEITLYIGADGEWTMHVFDLAGPWVSTHHDVSNRNPFLSTVEYNAWK